MQLEPKQPNQKEEKVARVCEAILEIIWTSGLSSVTHSRAARRARVSRPWIYSYIGKTREDLIDCAVNYFGQVFSLMGWTKVSHDFDSWVEIQIERLYYNFKQYDAYKFMLPIYFRFKGSDTVIGRRIEQIEVEYLRRSTLEVKDIFQTDPATASRLALTVASTKLGLLHRWHSLEPKDETKAALILGVYRQMLNGLRTR